MTLLQQRPRSGGDFEAVQSSRLRLVREPAADPPACYVADELLVREEHRRTARRVLGAGRPGRVVEDPVPVCGLRRFRVPDLDVPAAVEAVGRISRRAGDPRPSAGPNHLVMAAPFEHAGPLAPSVPAPPARVADLVAHLAADRVRVAVLDTGVRGDPSVAGLHATLVAGVIAQRTLAAHVSVVRVLDDTGLGTEFDLVRALARIPPQIALINLSLGGFCLGDRPPLALGVALERLLRTGDRLVVAAAGNAGERRRPFWPAAFAGGDESWQRRVVAVAAHDGNELCGWSNAGHWVTVTAPGLLAPAAGPDDDAPAPYVSGPGRARGWALWSGTSFAAPYVVAAVAEQVRATGSALAALGAVMRGATRTYGGYPGLG